jgi:hypothetical protein
MWVASWEDGLVVEAGVTAVCIFFTIIFLTLSPPCGPDLRVDLV